MMDVPDYTLLEIFSYLTKRELMKFALVSRRWYRLCYDRYLWKDITTDEFLSINIEDHIVMNLLNYGKNIKKLSLRGCYQVSNKVLKDLSLNGSRLQHLNLENCFKITDRGIMVLSKQCSTLRTVNLLNTIVTESGLCYLIKENPNILEFTASPTAVTEKTLKVLAINCKLLESLHVEHNEFTPPRNKDRSKNQHVEVLSSAMIEFLAMNCSKLQVLIMKYAITCVSDWAMVLLGHYCKKLECVEIGHLLHTAAVSDAGVANLCSGLKNLQRLDLTETYITDVTLCAIAKNCPYLEHLSIGNTGPVSDIGVLNIMKGCPNLDSFCIRCGFQSRLTDMSVFAIAQSVCSYNLIKLSMKCWDITDFGLFILARNLPNLMYLSLEGCIHLTNNGLKEALTYLKNLQSLDLSQTKCVKDNEELYNISFLLPQSFQSIFLQSGNGITENGCRNFQGELPDCEIIFLN